MDQQTRAKQAQAFITALQAVENDDPAGIENLVALFADDAELTNPAIQREGGPRKGRGQIAEFWQNYRASFQEIHSQFYEVTINESAAGLFWHSTGTHVTGEPVSYDGVSLLSFDDAGSIQMFKGFYDSQQVTTKAAA